MKHILLIGLLASVLVTGCDSDSESHSNLQHFPESPFVSTVTREVPAQYTTIQAAINAAKSGDTVGVAAGTFSEDITVDGKRLNIQGSGTGVTIIAGQVLIDDDSDVSIDGLTITGGGLYVRKSWIVLAGMQITGNPGFGLWVDECMNFAVSNSFITNNAGEGIRIDASPGALISNTISGNFGDGVIINHASAGLAGNTIQANGRDGVVIRGINFSASPSLIDNTVLNNGTSGNSDIICFGGNTNPTGSGNVFARCTNCVECANMSKPKTYLQ